ncbi:D-alanyl-D-alanine carboxypeptidase family protein [Novosphingobium sp.]|uniref:D-alanyl-D-alanine carboxypeptidase family protein n=1 Tax=Novosphingobium sp. TaxID=1874826 RepID=UPI00286CC74E|nr:D-alanyl-D-alanine carboxypeptidase family protein [Novosphingobium sp.]
MNTRLLATLCLLALPGLAPAMTVQIPDPPRWTNLPLQTQAPIALLADLGAGQILFARDADKRLLPASMTKAMTALVAFDLIKNGKLDEAAVVTIRPETANRWAGKGATLNLRPGDQVRIGDLLMGTTTVSANDAAVALAEAASGSVDGFVAQMNARALVLGMKGSHFANPNGMPDGGATYVTANDLVRLATALIKDHPALYARYFGKKTMVWHGARMISHDPFAGVLPGADGIKTGHTREAGFNFLGAVARDGRRLVVVIGGAPSEPARAAAAMALAEWGYSAWRSAAFLPAGTVVGAARVQGGNQRTVPLVVPHAYALALPRGRQPSVTGRIIYTGPLSAPFEGGRQVGRLEISVPGQPVHSLPLVAGNAVSPAGPIDRIVNALLGLFA